MTDDFDIVPNTIIITVAILAMLLASAWVNYFATETAVPGELIDATMFVLTGLYPLVLFLLLGRLIASIDRSNRQFVVAVAVSALFLYWGISMATKTEWQTVDMTADVIKISVGIALLPLVRPIGEILAPRLEPLLNHHGVIDND